MLYHMPRGASASLYCEHGFILTSLVSHPEGPFPMPGSRQYSPGFSLYCVRPLGLSNLVVLSALARCVNKVQASIYFQPITPSSAPLWFRTLLVLPIIRFCPFGPFLLGTASHRSLVVRSYQWREKCYPF